MKKQLDPTPFFITVAQLAERLGLPYEGDGGVVVRGTASLEEAGPGDLVYVKERKHASLLESTKASAAIIPEDLEFSRIPVIKSSLPRLSFIAVLEMFFPPFKPLPGIHPQAEIAASAIIGADVSIGAFAVVGEDAVIGDECVIFPLVSIYPGVEIGRECILHSQTVLREGVRIGDRVIVHGGVVIGTDGFGYVRNEDGSHRKIPQKGGVIIEDDVEVGANCAIDRATLGNTIVGKGTKIDNLVQIGHNVSVGRHTILISQVGIAGSSSVGDNVILSGQVGIADHVHFGDRVVVAAKSGVTKDIPPDSMAAGIPHLDIREWRKAYASLPHLHSLLREFKKLKKRVEDMENRSR